MSSPGRFRAPRPLSHLALAHLLKHIESMKFYEQRLVACGFLFVFALMGAVCLAPGQAMAQPGGPCSSPYATVKGLLDWLQPDTYEPARAGKCIARSKAASSEDAGDLAVKLIQVLDAKGLYIDISSLPGDVDYTNPQGLSRYQLSVAEPLLYLEKERGQWLWSEETIRAIPGLHNALFVYDLQRLIQRLPTPLHARVLGVATWQLVGLLIFLLAAFLCRGLVRILVVGQVRGAMRRLDIQWGDELLRQVGSPAGSLVGAGLLMLFWPILRLPVQVNKAALVGLRTFIALCIVLILYRVVDLFTTWLRQKALITDSKLDDQLVPLVRRALKIFVLSIGAVFVLQSLEYDIAGLLAGLGIGGLAFALAAKDTIANLFGSATIFASKPFQIGDSIVVDGVEGVVEMVGFRSTRIRTFYDSVVTIPNAKIADSFVDNKGLRKYRRFRTTLGLTYDSTPAQIQAFVEGIRAIIRANPGSRKDSYEVHFVEFGESSLNILVYMFFEVGGWSEELKHKHNLLLEVMRLAEELGLSFAFPTQTVHVEAMATAKEHTPIQLPDDVALAKSVEAFAPEGALSRPLGIPMTNGYLPVE